MNALDIALTTEELALCVSLLGYSEDAAVILRAQYGDISPEVARAYLEAASHSLLARESIAMENGRPALSQQLQELVQGFIDTQFTLQFQKRPREGSPLSLSLHFTPKGVLAHMLVYEVVHRFGWVSTEDALVSGWLFFEVPREQWEDEKEFGLVPAEAFRQFYKARNREEMDAALASMNLPQEAASQLAEDLIHAHYRGVIVRIDYDEQRQPYSNEGAFVLQGPHRTWMFSAVPEQENVLRVQWMSLGAYRSLVRSLIQNEKPSQAAS